MAVSVRSVSVVRVVLVTGLLLTLLALATLLRIARADPAVLYVKPDGSGNCSTWDDACALQTALTTAGSGDEIWVAPGVYRIAAELNIPASKTLTLRSTESRAAVIDGQGVCRGITISGTNSVVEGFTVRHGYDPGYGGWCSCPGRQRFGTA